MTRALAVLLVLAGCAAPPVATLPLPTGAEVVARVGDGRALGLDTAGRLYVVDAAAATVVVLGPGRERLPTIGGPGTEPGTFVEPSDVDAGGGLAVFVADAAGGTVTRFTERQQAVETVAIPDVDPSRAAPPPDAAQAAAEGRIPRGRPVAVAQLPGGGLAVAEANRGVILLLDARRRLERVVGGTDADRLARPVGVAVAPEGALWIADRDAIVVVSPLGEVRAVRPAADFGVGALRRVRRAGRAMLVVGDAGVAVVGDTVRTIPLALGEPVADAALADDGALYVLTRTRLVRLAAP